jgi:hypothetical protein
MVWVSCANLSLLRARPGQHRANCCGLCVVGCAIRAARFFPQPRCVEQSVWANSPRPGISCDVRKTREKSGNVNSSLFFFLRSFLVHPVPRKSLKFRLGLNSTSLLGTRERKAKWFKRSHRFVRRKVFSAASVIMRFTAASTSAAWATPKRADGTKSPVGSSKSIAASAPSASPSVSALRRKSPCLNLRAWCDAAESPIRSTLEMPTGS